VEVLKKGLLNFTVVIMKNCGHVPMIERPQEASEHYLAFLKGKERHFCQIYSQMAPRERRKG
jgi:abhydrolase domain-containing protein 6